MVFEESLGVPSVALEKSCTIRNSWDGMGDDEPVVTKKMCDGPECRLVRYETLPEYLKDNEFILDYYRCEWPLKQTVLSIFSIHNETLNVWTHLIGFLIFLSLTVLAATMMGSASGDELRTCSLLAEDTMRLPSAWRLLANCLPERFRIADNLTNPCALITMNGVDRQSGGRNCPFSTCSTDCQSEFLLILTSSYDRQSSAKDGTDNMTSPLSVEAITRWPFFAFLCGAMFCLLTSSVCHLVSCHSERTAYAMLRLDYAGISALIVTSAYPLVYYSFTCEPFFRNLYMGFITVFGVATVLVSLVPAFQTAEFRSARALLFFCMGVSGLVPITHKLVAFNDRPEAITSAAYELLMGVFYGLGVLVYATRVPERWMPGKFDLVGHSHQLFHVLVIAGACTHYLAVLQYLQWRDREGCY